MSTEIKVLLAEHAIAGIFNMSVPKFHRQFIATNRLRPRYTTGSIALYLPADVQKLAAELDQQATTPKTIATITTNSRSLKS